MNQTRNPVVIIPARLASTRLPDKPLADIHGDPMIVHCWRRAVTELQIRLERRGSVDWKAMPYFQGLKEFAPGRISKRYAIATGAISDWLVPKDYQPSAQDVVVDFEIEDAFGTATEQNLGNAAGKTSLFHTPCCASAQVMRPFWLTVATDCSSPFTGRPPGPPK